jgi:hypothetical protein
VTIDVAIIERPNLSLLAGAPFDPGRKVFGYWHDVSLRTNVDSSTDP